jgi:signal transduction histidine kinase/ligand-binding sensor domain-containing protein
LFATHSFSQLCDRRLGRLLLVLFLTALQGSLLFGQASCAANLQVGHDVWTFKEGAPEDVIALAQTADGFLWLGTPTGLVRFDGTRFEPFHSPFGDKLLSTNIYSLLAAPSGGLWIGYTFGAFSFLKDGRVTNYSVEIASSTGTVWGFAQDRAGILWAATTSGLWRFDHSSWQHLGAEWNAPLGSVGKVGFDREGTLWALTGAASLSARQLFYLSPGTRKFQAAETDLSVLGFTLDPDGNVVTSPASKLLLRESSGNSNGRPLAYPVLRKDSSQIIDRTNSVWTESEKPPLTRLAPSQPPYNCLEKASGSNSETYSVFPYSTSKLVDREGNIWFGDSKGLHRFFYSPLIRQEFPKSRADSHFFTVAPDHHGAVWITIGNYGSSNGSSSLYRGSYGTAELRRSTPGLVGFAYSAPDETFWFGGPGGLWHLAGGNLVQVDLPREMANQATFLQTITQDRLGGMWVSFGRHGLYRFANGVWTPYGGREDLPKTGVVIEFTDNLGRVWFGYTKNTLAVLDADRVQVFGPSDGLRVGNITAIYGRGSEIWIGGEFGLQQFDQGRLHNINAVDEQWLRGISGIVQTANGDLWLNGLGGIFHVRRSEISEALKKPAYQVKGERFGRREGMPGLARQVRPLNTAMEGTDGRLWFTGSDGVVWLDPTRSENKILPPPISIQSVSAADKFYAAISPLKFPARTSSVQINYAAVSLSDPEAIRFRYKLRESDADWHEVSSASPVSYRNLAPGSYHFSVAATDTNGVWSDKVATAEFTILPAFYQTAWFRLACAAAVLLLLWASYQLRVQQLHRQFAIGLEARVHERTRIARELHDTLLQSFHGLMFQFQAVRNLLPRRPEDAMRSLDVAISDTKEALAESRHAIQGLRSELAANRNLAEFLMATSQELVQAGNGDQESPKFDLIEEGERRTLCPATQNEVCRIALEILRNAYQHAHARRIEAEVRYGDQSLRLRIRDDGKGIDPNVLKEGGSAGHWGLRGVRERAERIGAQVDFWSEAGAGTEVQLAVPAAVAYDTSRSGVASGLLSKVRNRAKHS